MKIFLLVVLIIMFLYRVKDTLRSLSKKRHDLIMKTSIERLKKKKENMSDYEWDVVKLMTIVITLILYISFASIYILVWNELGIDNKYIALLSGLQIATVLYNIKESMFVRDIISFNIDDYKFHRFWNLFNVILDYIYYPVAILMLLK